MATKRMSLLVPVVINPTLNSWLVGNPELDPKETKCSWEFGWLNRMFTSFTKWCYTDYYETCDRYHSG